MERGASKSEEDLYNDIEEEEPTSDSFWEIGNYRRVVKRIEDGQRLCNDLIKMAQEKSEIESKYAKSLQNWSRKWEELVTNGHEYGSLEVGWISSLRESLRMAELHLEISGAISNEIEQGIQTWKKGHFHKSIVHLKETKRAEEGFSTAQKPWSKRLSKCTRAKKAYHQSAKELHILANQVHEAGLSPDTTVEQYQKLTAKHDKAKTERDRLLEKYEYRLEDVQRYKSR